MHVFFFPFNPSIAGAVEEGITTTRDTKYNPVPSEGMSKILYQSATRIDQLPP